MRSLIQENNHNSSQNGTQVAGYTYDANGNMADLSYSNGAAAEYLYNYANMLSELTNKRGAEVLSSYAYDYYLDGNQKSKTENTGRITAYAYDGLGRLSGESTDLEGETAAIGYAYDDYGNRSAMIAAGEDDYEAHYAYDKNNRLLSRVKDDGASREITDYFYDKNGNQISKRMSVTDESQGAEGVFIQDAAKAGSLVESYEYNALNQLTQSTVDGVLAQYTYQPDGLRYSKSVGSDVTRFLWDGGRLALELDGENAVLAKYAGGVGGIYREDSLEDRQYYIYNGHGDVVQLTNNSGTVTKGYDYDAFGVERNPDVNDNNPLRYCGEYFDKETGTIYLRVRSYDPSVGRFTQEDSVRGNVNAPLSLNLYTYCHNNPVIYTDPSGYNPATKKYIYLGEYIYKFVPDTKASNLLVDIGGLVIPFGSEIVDGVSGLLSGTQTITYDDAEKVKNGVSYLLDALNLASNLDNVKGISDILKTAGKPIANVAKTFSNILSIANITEDLFSDSAEINQITNIMYGDRMWAKTRENVIAKYLAYSSLVKKITDAGAVTYNTDWFGYVKDVNINYDMVNYIIANSGIDIDVVNKQFQ